MLKFEMKVINVHKYVLAWSIKYCSEWIENMVENSIIF